MVEKTGAARPYFVGVNALVVADKPAFACFGLKRATVAQPIGVITGISSIYGLAHVSVALIVVYGSNGPIDGNFVEIRTS